MTKVVMTGGYGFLGWHLRVRLRAVHDKEVTVLDRETISNPAALQRALDDADTLIHLAAVNRAGSDEEIERNNVGVAEAIGNALAANDRPVHVVYSNSIQSGNNSPYGQGKQKAYRLLAEAAAKNQSSLADVHLPNLFGEHGRPHYNSFVATFCHEIAIGNEPQVTQDRTVTLLHVQRAAEVLINAVHRRNDHQVRPKGVQRTVSEVLRQLKGFDRVYTGLGQIPDLSDDFSVDLFNTFRSYLFPNQFPLRSTVNKDSRGELFEGVRVHGGTGQTFVSTTVPWASRGDHYHLNKVERFFVIQGEAEISLRKMFDDKVIRLRVSGSDRSLVDMPTMWVHNIRNVGHTELITLFWTAQLLNPCASDTYSESVDRAPESSP